MAYRRSYRRKSYRPRRRTYRKKAPPKDDVWAVAKGAWNIGKKVLRLINVEHKHKIIAISKTIDSNGICIPMFHNDASHTHAVTQGDSRDQRNGNSIKPLTMSLKGTCWVPKTTTAPSGGDQLRVILFKHLQNNGQTVNVTDYLASNNVRDFKNYDNRFQYKTLYDKIFNLNILNSNMRSINFTKKLFGHMTYETGSNDIETGAYYLLLISTTSGVGSMPEFRAHWRMTYTDN